MYILTFKFANWNGKKSELVLINRLRFLKLSERGIHLKNQINLYIQTSISQDDCFLSSRDLNRPSDFLRIPGFL